MTLLRNTIWRSGRSNGSTKTIEIVDGMLDESKTE